jgi:hypothetical protein
MVEEVIDCSKDPLAGRQIWASSQVFGNNHNHSPLGSILNVAKFLEEETSVVIDTVIRDIVIQKPHLTDENGFSRPVNSSSVNHFYMRATNGSHSSEFVDNPLIFHYLKTPTIRIIVPTGIPIPLTLMMKQSQV